jgi:hypothetical protein
MEGGEPSRLTRRQRRTTGGSEVAVSFEGGYGVVGSGGGFGTATTAASSASSGAIHHHAGDVVVKSTVTVAEEHLAVDVVTTIAAPVLDEHEGMDDAALKEHEEVTKVKNVATLELGPYQMDTWYFSPLPKELFKDGGVVDVLYVDEFSLNFFTRKSELLRYQAKELPKNRRHPPGNEIYRCGNLSSELF